MSDTTWQFTFGDKSIRFDDLPIDKVQAVAALHGVTWYALAVSRPLVHPAAFHGLACVAAELLEVPLPAKPATVGEMNEFIELMQPVPTDLPVMWEDGIPKADETTTP